MHGLVLSVGKRGCRLGLVELPLFVLTYFPRLHYIISLLSVPRLNKVFVPLTVALAQS